jgi:hypothetical protein
VVHLCQSIGMVADTSSLRSLAADPALLAESLRGLDPKQLQELSRQLAAISQSSSTSPSGTPLSGVSDTGSNDKEPSDLKLSSRDSRWPWRITLTSYPGQFGVRPIPLNWGEPDAEKRGPIVVSRAPSSIKRRNGMFSQNIVGCAGIPGPTATD